MRDLGVQVDRRPEKRQPTTVPRAQLGQSGHALDVAGERGQDHAAGRLRDHLVESPVDLPLATSGSLDLGVRAVGQERQDALVAERGQSLRVRALAVGWIPVELEVATVHHATHGRVDRQQPGLRDRVSDGDRLDRERPDARRCRRRG